MWTREDRERYREDDRRYPSDLTDVEWGIVGPLLSHYRTYVVNLREVVNAILYLQKTGCQWRSLPKDFGSWKTIWDWHSRFRREGVWDRLSAQLVRDARPRQGRPAEPSTGLVDSQSVVSATQTGERGVDGHKKIKGIKRHVLTCSRGFVLAVAVTAANVHDTAMMHTLLERAKIAGWSIARAKVDGIYTGPRINDAARHHQVDIEVASKPVMPGTGFMPLPLRWRIEATFGTLTNRYRRLTRNLEASPQAAENMFIAANARRLLHQYNRSVTEMM